MNDYNTYIPTRQLAEFVMKNEVAWQMRDSLIGFSCAEGSELSVEDKEYDYENNQMFSILADAKNCKIFDSELGDRKGFEDLIEWSVDEDLLVLVDNELLLCIASCDKKQVLDMVA